MIAVINTRQNPCTSAKAFALDTCLPQLNAVAFDYGVRRLTPKECERLQGFPDDWTRFGQKPDGTIFIQSDSQRYKQLGNAVTVPVAEYLGKMILNHQLKNQYPPE